jgi:hypothetical protein
MSEKLYTFTVSVVIYATKRIDVVAESEEEARAKMLDSDWYDSSTDPEDEEINFEAAILDEVREMDNE